MDLAPVAPSAGALAAAVILDLAFGDPVYAAHPVRLIGRTLTFLEERLRSIGFDGYGGGIALFVLLSAFWIGLWSAVILGAQTIAPWVGWAVHVFALYSMLAMRDLLRHAFAVERAAIQNDLAGARHAIAQLVGRDTDRMDFAACRRAAIESISENLTDGWVSPIFWYALGGIPGIVLFKVVSTMDSMVGYRTPRYLQFGWCGARTDDLMNLLPARLTWLLIAVCAMLLPGCSARKALVGGWRQHAIVPGPNSGWSEAAVAGAIQRRLVGPIWSGGKLVTELWLGYASDPEAGTPQDWRRAAILVAFTGLTAALLAGAGLLFRA
jgi:adenosylcobinamide-phosphate synthase